MRRLLVPVTANMAIDRVERELDGEPADTMHVVILSVQPKPVHWQTRGLFRETIEAHLLAKGLATCRPIARRLEAADVSYSVRVELGDLCSEILRCAREERCDRILLTADRLDWPRRLLLRATGWLASSTAGQVIHSSRIPVTVVH